MALLDRFRRPPSAGTSRRALPPPGVIRRERTMLAHAREDKLRDLGGLMLEMYRRDRFREDLLTDRCNQLLALDARMHELDEMLAAARHRTRSARCECGATPPWASQFCPRCGRSIGGQDATACNECGNSLPAGARFCASCGAAAGDAASSANGDQADEGEQAGDGIA